MQGDPEIGWIYKSNYPVEFIVKLCFLFNWKAVLVHIMHVVCIIWYNNWYVVVPGQWCLVESSIKDVLFYSCDLFIYLCKQQQKETYRQKHHTQSPVTFDIWIPFPTFYQHKVTFFSPVSAKNCKNHKRTPFQIITRKHVLIRNINWGLWSFQLF